MEYLLPILLISISLGIFIFLLYLAKVSITFIKKNLSVIISYLIMVIIIFIILNNFYSIGNSLNYNIIKFIDNYITFMGACGLGIIAVAPIVGIIQKINENRIIKQYELKHKITKYEYYREIVGDIPPAILSVIYNRDINIEDQIISTIVYLKEKQMISFENNKIVVINNSIQLSNHEKIIIEYIDGQIDNKAFKQKYQSLLMEDLKKQKYIIVKSKDIFDMTELMQLIIIWIIISMIIFMPVIVNVSKIGLSLVLTYIFAFISIPIYKFINKKINPVIRTDKALELTSKLNGLKSFLQDFTTINDKKIEEVKLYDDYILYAIIFNLKGSLNNESKQLYHNIKMNLIKNNK